jgi:ferritin-like metal-binding protein YciE
MKPYEFVVEAKIANLSPDVVRRIFESAVSYYIEEHLAETHPEYAALTDSEASDWEFKTKFLL